MPALLLDNVSMAVSDSDMLRNTDSHHHGQQTVLMLVTDILTSLPFLVLLVGVSEGLLGYCQCFHLNTVVPKIPDLGLQAASFPDSVAVCLLKPKEL